VSERPHIMFVDDEPAMLSGLRRSLRGQRDRWDLSFANGGEEALRILEKQRCDVVVSDFRMPGIDGADLLQIVRKQYPGTARLILSGHTDETDLLRVILLAHQFVHKPCKEEDLVAAIERVLALRSTLANADVRREVSGIEFLPSPPSALRDLLSVLESEDASAKSVAQSLTRDPATTAKILQLVNSASSGLSHRVSDMTQAVSLLGLRNVRSLVLLHDLIRDFNPPITTRVDWVSELTRHAVETSRLARVLSNGAHWVEDAFAAGLLLDIGQLVLASCRPDAFSVNYNAWLDGDGALCEIEERTFGVDHAAAGAYLLGLWALPFPVIEAVAAHSHPPKVLVPDDVVQTALLAHRIVEKELGAVCCEHDSRPAVDEAALPPATRDRIERWRADLHHEGVRAVNE
jgi:HD-like signal output (HDOD) protein/CheY-like chemotaxis protein